MNYHQSDCFTIGQCEFPAGIEYTECSEGDVTVHSCMIEVSGGDNQVWAKVDPEYFPAIERQLKQELEDAAERERNEITTPAQHNGDWPQMLRRQAS